MSKLGTCCHLTVQFTLFGPTSDANALVRSDAVTLSSLTNELLSSEENLVANFGEDMNLCAIVGGCFSVSGTLLVD